MDGADSVDCSAPPVNQIKLISDMLKLYSDIFDNDIAKVSRTLKKLDKNDGWTQSKYDIHRMYTFHGPPSVFCTMKCAFSMLYLHSYAIDTKGLSRGFSL